MTPTNFQAVRDGWKSKLQFIDVLLDTANPEDAPQVINVAGTAVYIDLASSGNVSLQFQGFTKDYSNPYVFAPPGSIFKAPFVQLAVSNIAQPGKFVRIIYGVDIEFEPGSSSAVQIAGSIVPIEVYISTNTGVPEFVTASLAANPARRWLLIKCTAAGGITFDGGATVLPMATGDVLTFDSSYVPRGVVDIDSGTFVLGEG